MSPGTPASAAGSLRAAYVRATVLGIAILAGTGAVAGIVQGLVSGYHGDIVILSVLYAAAGIGVGVLLAGGAAAVVALRGGFAASTRRSRMLGIPLATGVCGLLVGAGILALIPRAELWSAAPVGLGVGALALGLVAAAERRAVRKPVGASRLPAPSTSVQVLAIVGGGAAALVFASASVGLYRDRLHYLCSFGPPGTEAAGWACPDGISYLVPAAGLLMVAVGAVLAGLLVVLAGRESPRQRAFLTGLAALTAISGPAVTWLVSGAVGTASGAVARGELWMAAVGPSALVALLAAAISLVGLAVARRALPVPGVLLLVAAAVVQPGLAVLLLPAAALQAAAAAAAARAAPSRDRGGRSSVREASSRGIRSSAARGEDASDR